MPKQEKIEYLRKFPGIENDPTWKAEMEKEGITVEDLRQPQIQPEQLNIQEAPEEPGTLTTMAKGAAAGAVKGLTKNWYDDAFGNLAALAQSGTGNPYMPTNLDAQRFQDVKEEKAKEARSAVEGAIQAAPISGTIGEIGGQIASDVALGGLASKAIAPLSKIGELLSPAMTTYGRAVKSIPGASAVSDIAAGAAKTAIPGALSGGIEGAGAATGDKVAGAVEGAKVGGLVSGALGGVGTVLGKGRDVIARKYAPEDIVEKAKTLTAPELKELKTAPLYGRVSSLTEEAMPIREEAFKGASETASGIKEAISGATKDIGATVNQGKVSSATSKIDNAPLIQALESSLPDIEGGSKKTISKILETLKKSDNISVQKAELLANRLEKSAENAPSTIAPAIGDIVKTFRTSVKSALPEETTTLIEGTKDVLASQLPRATKKGSPEQFVKMLTAKGNEFSTKKALEQAAEATGKELPSFASIKSTADFLKTLPTNAAEMENFLVKAAKYEDEIASGIPSSSLKRQGERDFYELLAKNAPIKDSLLNLRTALKLNPTLAKEYFQRKMTQGATDVAKGNVGNALSSWSQALSGLAGSKALSSYSADTLGKFSRLGRAVANTKVSKDSE